jgi:hypothetical protein
VCEILRGQVGSKHAAAEVDAAGRGFWSGLTGPCACGSLHGHAMTPMSFFFFFFEK